MCEVESNDRPKWLLELENRKRKPRLAHEAGAGAPCVTCEAACPGLDLHFWRKICKNCKCSKDDHDVQDEDFPQFDLLFGNSRKYKKKSILLHINNEKEHAEEQAFEWVPPDITKELATDYMKALPVEKLPIKGSTGAALRRQLLQKQLPLHDIDHKACDKLSEQEQKQFEKYLESIKKYVGQGTVRKILSARPFDRTLMTPANATDMQRFSPQNKPNIPSSMVQLRTPSSFTPKTPYKKDLHDYLCNDPINSEITNNFGNVRNVPVLEKYNIIGNNGETVRSEPIKSGSYNKAAPSISSSKLPDNKYHDIAKKDVLMTGNSCLNSESVGNVKPEMATPWKPEECYKDTLRNPNASVLHSKAIDDNAQTAKSVLSDPNLINDNAQLAESILAEAFLPPSMVHANDIIGSTLDEKGLMYIREKLSNKYSSQENHGQIPYNSNYARDLDSNESLRKTGNISSQNTNANIDKGPDRSTVIAAMKNPSEVPASQDKIQRNTIESKPMRAEKDVLKAASQIIQSAPLNANEKENTSLISSCKTMDNPVTLSSPQTRPQIANVDNHPAKLNSFTIPSSVIYSEKLQNQIFPHDSIGTANQSVQNLPNIESLRGAMEDLTVDTKQQKCHKCEEEIRVGDVAVVTEKVKNTMWHPGCFVCNTCNELLVDLVYFYYKNKLYCGRDLATLLGIPRCFACDELIFVREYTVAEGHNYHVKHFCCWDCDVPLAGKQYITENDRPLCLLCYQKTYAKTCNTCEKVIAADQQGVAVKDLNFHATENCFCCHICKKNLLNGRMAVKESRLFCSKECISQFLHPQS